MGSLCSSFLESEDTCTMLDEAHDRFFIALESVRMALLEQADRIQTLGLTTIWTNTQLAQLGTLTDLLTDLVVPLQTLRNVLITDKHGLCSNCVAQDDEHDSGTFLTALTEEKIDDMNCALIYLKDVLERLLYDRAFEIAWLKILSGVTNLAETIDQGTSPLDRTRTMVDTLTRLTNALRTPLQNYLNASQPSAAHLAASQNLAAILAADFQPVPLHCPLPTRPGKKMSLPRLNKSSGWLLLYGEHMLHSNKRSFSNNPRSSKFWLNSSPSSRKWLNSVIKYRPPCSLPSFLRIALRIAHN